MRTLPELTPGIVAILRKYTHNRAALGRSRATLTELAIDRLDLPMIVLDIEDAFNAHIRCDDEIEGVTTVQDLVACIAARLEANARQQRLRASSPRIKRTWLSTDADQTR